MQEQTIEKTIDASPTKDLFISMLVKDIPLVRALVDLVDNSVDGARRLRGDGSLKGLEVRISIEKNTFKVTDNCGGIPVDIAQKYAFRFGRSSENSNQTKHSVGQFGVGMKRALFKLGQKFRIESTTNSSHFVVEVDVNEWKANEKTWEFQFKELEENLSNVLPEKIGTVITATALHELVAQDLALENFQIQLIADIEEAHQDSLDKGLNITFNGIPLKFRPFGLLNSERLKPAFKIMDFETEGKSPVKVKIYAGIADSNPNDAGWYIFCNGRLILGAAQTQTVGWGEGVPKYHNQFARFRGYVFTTRMTRAYFLGIQQKLE
jgi:hypothetical protein